MCVGAVIPDDGSSSQVSSPSVTHTFLPPQTLSATNSVQQLAVQVQLSSDLLEHGERPNELHSDATVSEGV